MSRASTLARLADLKTQVLDLERLDGLAGEGWARAEILAAAVRLEMLGRRLEAAGKREQGTQLAPPAQPGQPDFRERQLPPGDRT